MDINLTRDCYDAYGYPNARGRAIQAEQKRLLDLIREREPDAHVTYHSEIGYVVHVWGRELSGYKHGRGTAIADAHQRMFPSI